MAKTAIADVWSPDIWIPSVSEKQATFPNLFNSGIVIRTPEFDELASGGGIKTNMPIFKDTTDEDDEIQVEDTAPVNTNGISTVTMVAPILNRVCKNGATALSAAVSGSDPIGIMTQRIAMRRAKQRQKTLIAMLRGAFGTAGERNAAAALAAMRLGGTVDEPFDESGQDATSDQSFGPEMFIDMKAMLGELADDLENSGILFMHPNVLARLEKLDKDGFKTGKPSDLPFNITMYRGIRIAKTESLMRAGTESGYVYDTYLAAAGTVAIGEKPQVGDKVDVSSLQFDTDADKNNEYIYDRTRFIMHLNGTKWIGNPAGQSATNAELQLAANWQSAYQTPNRVGVVCVRTNR
jgi:hypothetical protein